MFCWRMELLAMVIGKLGRSCQISPATGNASTLCTKAEVLQNRWFSGLEALERLEGLEGVATCGTVSKAAGGSMPVMQ